MGLTLKQAENAIGRKVIYRSEAQRQGRDKRPAEEGEIIRVGRDYVFVRYERGVVAATRPADLTFVTAALDDDEEKDRMHDAREALRSFEEVDR